MLRRLYISIAILLASVSANAITLEQAVDTLYARMSLPDSLDYPRSFFVENARMSLLARENMPWGKTISEPTTNVSIRAARSSTTSLHRVSAA